MLYFRFFFHWPKSEKQQSQPTNLCYVKVVASQTKRHKKKTTTAPTNVPTRWKICSVISHYVSVAHMHTCFAFDMNWYYCCTDRSVCRFRAIWERVSFVYLYCMILKSLSSRMNKNERFCILCREKTELICIAFHLYQWTSISFHKKVRHRFTCTGRIDRSFRNYKWLKCTLKHWHDMNSKHMAKAFTVSFVSLLLNTIMKRKTIHSEMPPFQCLD